MLVHALTPPSPSIQRPPTTYGGLIEAASLAVKEAILLPRTRPITPERAWAELLGYQRFVRTCGIHLGLLTRFQVGVTTEQRHVVNRLMAVPLRDTRPSSWTRAAHTLGAAHDLFATHLDANQLPRTAEIEDLLTPAAVLIPAHGITGLLVDAVNAGTHLVDTAVASQRNLAPRLIPRGELQAFRAWTNSARPYVKAAHWDASELVGVGDQSAIARLEPAPILTAGPVATSDFDSTLDALRVLRQLTFAQARGSSPASPMSLRDLAGLGAAVSEPEVSWLPEPRTNLERLDRAQALDILETSHASWSQAAEDLTESILGLTRAPAEYAAALAKFGDVQGLTPMVRIACLSALPRLGNDAADAIGRLASHNALVDKQLEAGRLPLRWRPITPATADELACRFRTAAAHSETAALTLRRTLAAPAEPKAIEPSARPAPRRELELSRSVRR